MEKQQIDDRLSVARSEDLFTLAHKRNRPCFSSFLSEHECVVYGSHLKKLHAYFMLYGGYDDALRKVCGVFPGENCGAEEFPLCPVTVNISGNEALTNRDILGALMALGIKREVLGDIIVSDSTAVFFCLESQRDYLLSELKKAGRAVVSCTAGLPKNFSLERRYETLAGVMASERLDCFVTLVCNFSRSQADDLVCRGLVSLNGIECTVKTRILHTGDTVSVRGHGKFIYLGQKNTTRSGRLCVSYKKFI